MIYYFAYGSNMDKDDLDKRCKEKGWTTVRFQNVSPAKLNGYQLRFNYYSINRGGGAANIMESNENCVYGLLMELDEGELKTIRKKEGYSEDCSKCHYNEVCVKVEKFDGEEISNVKTYKVSKSREEPENIPPTEDYIKRMIKNALEKENKFPKEYIQELEEYLKLARNTKDTKNKSSKNVQAT